MKQANIFLIFVFIIGCLALPASALTIEENVARQGTASAGSSNAAYTPDKAIDGSDTSFWQCGTSMSGTGGGYGAAYKYWQIDLKQAYEIVKIEINIRTAETGFTLLADTNASFSSADIIGETVDYLESQSFTYDLSAPKSYRYFKVEMHGEFAFLSINEFAAFARIIGVPESHTNVALNKPAVASQYYDEPFGAMAAVDGNNSTIWAVGSKLDRGRLEGLYDYLLIDLVKRHYISKVELQTRQGDFGPEPRQNFVIELSATADFKNAFQVARQDAPLAVGAKGSYFVESDDKFRYVRVRKTVAEDFSIAELAVWGEEASVVDLVNSAESPAEVTKTEAASYLQLDFGKKFILSSAAVTAGAEGLPAFKILLSNDPDFQAFNQVCLLEQAGLSTGETAKKNTPERSYFQYVRMTASPENIAQIQVFADIDAQDYSVNAHEIQVMLEFLRTAQNSFAEKINYFHYNPPFLAVESLADVEACVNLDQAFVWARENSPEYASLADAESLLCAALVTDALSQGDAARIEAIAKNYAAGTTNLFPDGSASVLAPLSKLFVKLRGTGFSDFADMKGALEKGLGFALLSAGTRAEKAQALLDYDTLLRLETDKQLKKGLTATEIAKYLEVTDQDVFLENPGQAVSNAADAALKAKQPPKLSGDKGGGGGSVSLQDKIDQNASKPMVEPNKTTDEENLIFSDLPADHWAATAIYTLTKQGILNGKAEFLFVPNDPVTREEAAKMLALRFGFFAEHFGEPFNDCDIGAWYYPYVGTLKGKGIIRGDGQNNFGLGVAMSRADFAVLVYRSMLEDGYPFRRVEEASFSDNTGIPDYAREAISALVSEGKLQGYGDGSFRPNESVSRAEAAALLFRLEAAA